MYFGRCNASCFFYCFVVKLHSTNLNHISNASAIKKLFEHGFKETSNAKVRQLSGSSNLKCKKAPRNSFCIHSLFPNQNAEVKI